MIPKLIVLLKPNSVTDKTCSQKMSSRGRFSSRFIKSGNYQKHKKPTYSDRDHSYRRRHPSERHGRPYSGGRGDSDERFLRRDFKSDHNSFEHYRERGFNKHSTRPYLRSPRTRHPRGKHIFCDERERDFKSPRHGQRGRFSMHKNRSYDDILEGDDFLMLNYDEDSELQFPIESIGCSDDDEGVDISEGHFERKMSPLIIHRNFEKDYDRSSSRESSLKSRPRSPLMLRSRSLIKDDHEHSASRSLRSEFSFKRSLSRSSSHEKIDIHYHQRSHRRSGSKETNSGEREKCVESDSLYLIKQQIRYERQRQKFLERQKRFHEKRSESSVERFLNDCKRSTERRSKSSSTTISRSVEYNRDTKNSNKIIASDKKSPSPYNQKNETNESHSELKIEKSVDKTGNSDLYCETSKRNINSTVSPGEIEMELSPISQAGSFNDKDLLSENKDHLQDRLSPVSQAGSFEKRDFPTDQKTSLKGSLHLSPISQTGSFEHDNAKEIPHESEMALSPISQSSSFEKKGSESHGNKLDLSPISQAGSFENKEISQDQVFSPISLTGSLDYKCKLTGKEELDNERPKSTDSMQKFLEEFRYSDRSRSSSPLSINDNKSKTNYVFSKNNNAKHEPYGRYKKEYSRIDSIYLCDTLNKYDNIKQTLLDDRIDRDDISRSSGITRRKYAVEENRENAKDRFYKYNMNIKDDFQNLKPYEIKYKETRIKDQVERQNNFLNIKKSNIVESTQNEKNFLGKQFQDTDQLFKRRLVDTTSYKSQGSLELSLVQQGYQRTNLDFSHNQPFDQFKSLMHNQTPGSFHNIEKPNHQSSVQERILKQTPNLLSHSINQQTTQSAPLSTFLGRSDNRAISNIFQYKPSIQHSQNHQISTDINPSQNYEKYNELSKNNMAYSFSTSTHQFPEKVNISVQPSQSTFGVGHCGKVLEKPIINLQNVQMNKYFATPNQSVSSWNLNKSGSSNLSANLYQEPGRLNENASNSSYQSNEINQPDRFGIANSNPSFFQEALIQNNGIANFSQRHVINTPTRYVVPYSIQNFEKPPPALQFQQNPANFQNLNQFGVQVSGRPPLMPYRQQASESGQNPPKNMTQGSETFQQPLRNQSIHQGLEGTYSSTHNFQHSQVNTNQSAQFHPDLNKQPEPFKPLGFQAQQTFQHKPTLRTEFRQGCNKNKSFPDSFRSNQNLSTGLFYEGQGTNLSQPLEQSQEKVNESTANITGIDIKNYLNGTFKPGYKSAVGFSSECETRSQLIGGNQLNPECECFPNPEFVMRYKDSPPSPEELGIMLDKFVIFFDVRQNSDLEKDPFVVIQDSFSKSKRFGKLDVEEQSQVRFSIFQPPPKE